jgi:prepilin-type processing-associated H-X9-DG protein
MKVNFHEQAIHGLTRFDVLAAFLLAISLLLLIMALPVYKAAQRRDANITCVENLKQIGLASRVWEADNGSPINPRPILLDTNFPTVGLNDGQIAWIHSIGFSNIVHSSKILQCPRDTETPMTTNSNGLKIRISYFWNLDASEGYPQQVMFGDDNLIFDGAGVKPGVFELTSKMSASWAPGRHGLANNIGLADGSVEQQSSAGLQNAVQYSFEGVPSLTNRIAIP